MLINKSTSNDNQVAININKYVTITSYYRKILISFVSICNNNIKKKNHKLISSFSRTTLLIPPSIHPHRSITFIIIYYTIFSLLSRQVPAFPTSRNNRILAISFQYRISITWLPNEICSTTAISLSPRLDLRSVHLSSR